MSERLDTRLADAVSEIDYLLRTLARDCQQVAVQDLFPGVEIDMATGLAEAAAQVLNNIRIETIDRLQILKRDLKDSPFSEGSE